MGETQRPEIPATSQAESFYNRMTAYRFVQRYAAGKDVADLCRENLEQGSRLLAQSAGSVTVMTYSESAPGFSPALPANVKRQEVRPSSLPYPNGYFDVVVALEVIEDLDHPEELLAEAKRILKSDGVLIVSTADRQTYSNERNRRDPTHRRELYAKEFEALLESRFERVRIYRQGVIAGGTILAPDGVSGVRIETSALSVPEPVFGDGPPATYLVLAVCSDAEIPAYEETLLLLDLDRRVYDECDEYREGVGLLRGEIGRMQETEVQAFQDAVLLERRETARLRKENKRLKDRLTGIETSVAWRILQACSRLRMRRASKKSE